MFPLYAGITMSASSLIPTTEPRFRVPDARGRFGQFGGMYVPETLMTPLLDLTIGACLRQTTNWPTPLTTAMPTTRPVVTLPSSRLSPTCSATTPDVPPDSIMPNR